jgi:hypothetical protein
MKHPNEADLALFAGHDLNFVSEWRIRRHIARCERCRDTADVFSSLRSEVATLKDLPSNIGWNRLASEMKANIRLGLAAGECVASKQSASESRLPVFSGLHTLLAYASLIALVVAGVWLQRPAPPATLSAAENGRAVLAATGEGIELTEGGRSLGLRYGASRDVNYSADAKGAVGARYVDTSTGYVTVVNVNVE